MAIHCDVRLKIIILGDSGVGKTCLLSRFADRSFTDEYRTTIGTDFKIRTVQLNGQWIKLQIWDTAGQERFRTIIKEYYRDSHGVLFVYDITKQATFGNIKEWIDTVAECAPESIEKVLVGNKCDCDNTKRQIPAAQGKQLADKCGCGFVETSAKTNIRVDEAFLSLTWAIVDKHRTDDSSGKEDSVRLSEGNQTTKCGC